MARYIILHYDGKAAHSLSCPEQSCRYAYVLTVMKPERICQLSAPAICEGDQRRHISCRTNGMPHSGGRILYRLTRRRLSTIRAKTFYEFVSVYHVTHLIAQKLLTQMKYTTEYNKCKLGKFSGEGLSRRFARIQQGA